MKKCPAARLPLSNPVDEAAGIKAPKRFRRLKWNELVTHGDYVPDGNHGFELWDGPTGFRADAFVKPIYRRERRQLVRR